MTITAAPRAVPTARPVRSASAQRRWTIIGFLVVPLGALIVFNLYPLAQLVWFSLTDWDGLSPTREFVGLANYRLLLIDEPQLLGSLVNSLYYFLGSCLQLVIATYFAVILNRKMPGSDAFRLILFLPFVLNTVAVTVVFRDFLQIGGGLDATLDMIGLGAAKQQWVQDPDLVKWSLVFASIWRYLGFQLLITYGALQSVPTDQYEAARLEGASEWQQFWRITFPSIRMILSLQLILATIGSLEVFDVPFLITGGANGTKTFVMVILEEAFEFRNVGIAAAMAVILLIAVMITIVVQRAVLVREPAR